jgi:hypothetical protein
MTAPTAPTTPTATVKKKTSLRSRIGWCVATAITIAVIHAGTTSTNNNTGAGSSTTSPWDPSAQIIKQHVCGSVGFPVSWQDIQTQLQVAYQNGQISYMPSMTEIQNDAVFC